MIHTCYVSCAMPWPRSTQRVWSYRGLSCLVPLQAVTGMVLALLLLAVSDQRGAAVLGIANLCVAAFGITIVYAGRPAARKAFILCRPPTPHPPTTEPGALLDDAWID
eukprot:COSAG01_NODE_19025_length_1035_cov_2.669872_2_plen_108_part_00